MLLGGICWGTAAAADQPAAAPLVLEHVIRLPEVSGRIDHMAVDGGQKRLFVAELGNGTLDVIDLETQRLIHRLSGFQEPQGVGFAPGINLLAVASGGDGTVRLFRGSDYAPAGEVELGDDADDVRLEPRNSMLLVGYGSGGLAVIDPARASVTSRIKLAAHPEGFQLDPIKHRAFVNIPDAGQIAVIDLATGRQVATWRVAGLAANFPMALNPEEQLLATVFRSPARLILLNLRSGAVVSELSTCKDADDVFFDPKPRRIYVSCGQGFVDVFQGGAQGYRRIAELKTKSGARTSLFLPESGRLFVAARAGGFGSGSDAAILVFKRMD